MPTLKQAEILRRYGFIDVDEWSRREAGSIINQIARNGWKLPEWIDKPSEYVPPSLRFDNYYKSLEWNDAI
jgi:hypothetical protein